MKKLFALLLAVLMVFSLVACTTSTNNDTTAGKTSDDTTAAPADDTTAAPVTEPDNEGEVEYLGEVEIFQAAAVNPGLCTGWMPDWVRENYGVDMIGIQEEDGKFEMLMAAGALPDVTIVKGYENMALAIEGGFLLDLETVADKLPNVFETYYDANKNMINYIKDNVSAGTGKLYGLGRMFTSTEIPDMDIGGIYLRYDVYGEVGYPEIHSLDDLFNCLVAMQAAHPTTEDGQKVYAYSGEVVSSGQAAFWSRVARATGYGDGLAERDYSVYAETGDYHDVIIRSALADDSGYKEYLQFMFNCNQAGLIDPNTLTQTGTESDNKTKNGLTLMNMDAWGTTWSKELQDEGKGFRRVSIGMVVGMDLTPVPGGGTSFVTISSACKNLEAACALLNGMFDPAWTISALNGPQGEVWDFAEDGTPYFLEGGYDKMNSLNFSERGCIIMLTYHFSGQMPGCPEGITSDYSTWPCYNEMVADGTIVETKVISDWKEHTSNGYHLLTDYFKEKGKLILSPSAASRTLSTDESMSASRLNDRINVGTWACIFAADEATFDAEWDAMYNECVGMGYNEFVDTMAAYKIADVEEFQQIGRAHV